VQNGITYPPVERKGNNEASGIEVRGKVPGQGVIDPRLDRRHLTSVDILSCKLTI
jgi:hypothetical protein